MVQQNSASESTINKSENTHDPKKQVMIEYEFLERMFDLTGKQVSDYDPNSKEAKIIRKCFAIIDIQVDQIKKIRTSLMRRQNVIFVAMIIVGLFLTITSQLIDKRLLSEGIAFIIVGFVGMLMSWTTMDIGASIKEAIYDVGRQNLTVLESIAKSQNEMVKSQNEMVKSQNEMVKSLNEMVKSLNEMVKSLNEMVKSLNEIKEILQDK